MITGLDQLLVAMRSRGLAKNQVESKLVPIVLDLILEDNEGTYLKRYELEKEVRMQEEELQDLKRDKALLENGISKLKEEYNRLNREVRQAANKTQAEILDYIDRFNESLEQCETPESRDALRKAQIFANSVEVNTPQNNTAYINGMWALLSATSIADIDKIFKISKEKAEESEDIPAIGLKRRII